MSAWDEGITNWSNPVKLVNYVEIKLDKLIENN